MSPDRFDPVSEVINSRDILEAGQWPNFHDAEVHYLHIDRGDVRPDDDVWIGVSIEAAFELCALKIPYIAVLKFHDCEDIALQDFNHQNAVYDLEFSLQQRGTYNDGSPLPPWVCVSFEQAFGLRLTFKCMRIEALQRTAVNRT